MTSNSKKKITTVNTPPKIVLVLGAGGVKGIAHIGVLEVLEKAGIPIDLIIGCSIGAIIGAFYASGLDTAQILKIAKIIIPNRPSYQRLGFPYLRKGLSGKGFFTVTKLKELLAQELPNNSFESLKIPLKACAVDLHKGKLELLESGSLIDAILASACIPGFFQPVTIDNKSYVDGGIISELPIEQAKKLGAKIIIGSNVKGWLKIETNKKIKNIIVRSYDILRHHHDKKEESKADIIIRPDLSGLMDRLFSKPTRIKEIYERGKLYAEKALPDIKALLKDLEEKP